jgi:hypothetical protein
VNLSTFFMTAALCFLAGCAARRAGQQIQHDDAHYGSALRSYLSDLKPGVSRKEVEDYFRARSISFSRGNDHYTNRSSPAFDLSYPDIIGLREETRPWPCGSSDVYVVFKFTGHRPYSGVGNIEADDTDTLESIHIWKIYDCF